MESIFEPSSQHGDIESKIVASLERLSQVFRILLREEAQERGLSLIQARFLVHLLFHEVELGRVGRLAEEFDLTRATVSDAVGSLEEKGLIYREPWPEDKRVATLRLILAGEKLAAELSTWANTVREHLAASSPEEKETVMRFLMQLIASLQRSGVIIVSWMCVTCRFFRRDSTQEAATRPTTARCWTCRWPAPTSGSTARTRTRYALSTIIHTLHILLAGSWLGGVIFTTVIVSPALKMMEWGEAERVKVHSIIGRRYAQVGGMNLALLLVLAFLDGLTAGFGTIFYAEYALLLVLFGLVAAHGAYFGRKLVSLAEAERRVESLETAASFAEQRRALQRVSGKVSMLDIAVSVVIMVLAING